MPVGAPDNADVRRHYFARTVDSQSLTLAANQFQGFSYTADQMADCAMLRIIASPGVCVVTDTFGVGGDLAESFKLMQATAWPRAVRLPLSNFGGGMDVLVQDTTGVAGKLCTFTVESYVGVTAQEIGPWHRETSTGLVTLANGAFLPAHLSFPDATYYDRMALLVVGQAAAMSLGINTFTNGDITSTAGTIQTATYGLTLSATPNPPAQYLDFPTVAPFDINVLNSSGNPATVMVNARCYRAS